MPIAPRVLADNFSSSSSPEVQGTKRLMPSWRRFDQIACMERPGSSSSKSTDLRKRPSFRTCSSYCVQARPFPAIEELSYLSAPELLLAGRTLDGLAGSVALFVELEVAVRAHEVDSYPAEAVFEVVTISTHAITRLLRSMKRRSLRRSWPRLVFAN